MDDKMILREAVLACRYAVAYDAAIRECAQDADRMDNYCTAKGENLDLLYRRWQQQSQKVLDMVSRGRQRTRGTRS